MPLAPHQHVPRWPSERAEMAAQERAAVAQEGATCLALADDIAIVCDRFDSQWSASDGPLVAALRRVLDEASEIARRIGR